MKAYRSGCNSGHYTASQRTVFSSTRPSHLRCMQRIAGRSSTSVAAELRTRLNKAMDMTVSPHPEAQRRRQEAEELARQREAERAKARDMQAQGLRWWETSLPSNMVILNDSGELLPLIASATGRLLVVNFFTQDCYTCKSLHPKLKKIAADNPDVLFAKLNGSDPQLRDLFESVGIKKVPYFHFYRDGKLVSHFSASLNPERLALLRAEIAGHKKARLAVADNAAYVALEN